MIYPPNETTQLEYKILTMCIENSNLTTSMSGGMSPSVTTGLDKQKIAFLAQNVYNIDMRLYMPFVAYFERKLLERLHDGRK